MQMKMSRTLHIPYSAKFSRVVNFANFNHMQKCFNQEYFTARIQDHSRQEFMVHKPPEPEGAARGQGLFMEHKFLPTVVYLLYSPL